MKKLYSLVLFAISAACLTGCGTEPDPKPTDDETQIVELEIVGNMKTTYDYNDEWDTSGLSVDGIQMNGERVTLKKSKYDLIYSVKYPRKLIKSLKVTAKLKEDRSIYGERMFSNISVEDEVYDAKQEVSDYYNGWSLSYSGKRLLNELHEKSFNTHTKFVTYSDVTNYFTKFYDYDSTDLIPGEHKTQMFYTGSKVNYDGGTKEHVWACADSSDLWVHDSRAGEHNVDNKSYIGGGSDLYHIRPCNSAVNNARGDAPFVELSEFSEAKKIVNIGTTYDSGALYSLKAYKKGYTSGTLTYADLVEPADEFKGDIARIVMYLYMHYSDLSGTPSEYEYMTGDLDLTQVISSSTGTLNRTIELIKKWNKLDPVSEVEKHRNHVVQQIQGNRNPFVDYPELIDEVFE